MEDIVGFGADDFVKVGIVCENCGTEFIYELNNEKAARAPFSACPICGDRGILTGDFLEYFRRMLALQKPKLTRLYFRKKKTPVTGGGSSQ